MVMVKINIVLQSDVTFAFAFTFTFAFTLPQSEYALSLRLLGPYTVMLH